MLKTPLRLLPLQVLGLDASNVEAIACLAADYFYSDQAEMALRYYRRLLQVCWQRLEGLDQADFAGVRRPVPDTGRPAMYETGIAGTSVPGGVSVNALIREVAMSVPNACSAVPHTCQPSAASWDALCHRQSAA